MSKRYTVEECIDIVNCCYFVGSCHACPAHKPTGYANICKCAGNKEVGEALLAILEPLHEAQKAKNPSLFDLVDAVEANTEEPEPEAVAGDFIQLPAAGQTGEGDEDGRGAEDQGQDLVSEDDSEPDQTAA